MPRPTPSQPRGRPGRRGVRTLAMLVSLTLSLAAKPTQAAAPATQACRDDVDAAPPPQALALKNAGQELRATGSLLRASACFRDAVEELPDCATFADERLRWGLWAAETRERAGAGADPELRAFLERQVARLEASPEGRALTDYPQLVAARDRQRQARPHSPGPAPIAASPPPPRASRVGLALMVGGAPLVVTGGVLTGLYAPQRSDIPDDSPAATRGTITGIALLGVGAGLLLAGMVTYLQGRRAERHAQHRVTRLRPSGTGLALQF